MVYKAHIPLVIAPIVTIICIFRAIELTVSTKYRRIKSALYTHVGAIYICADFEQLNPIQHYSTTETMHKLSSKTYISTYRPCFTY
jgi:hypothetical protein